MWPPYFFYVITFYIFAITIQNSIITNNKIPHTISIV